MSPPCALRSSGATLTGRGQRRAAARDVDIAPVVRGGHAGAIEKATGTSLDQRGYRKRVLFAKNGSGHAASRS